MARAIRRSDGRSEMKLQIQEINRRTGISTRKRSRPAKQLQLIRSPEGKSHVVQKDKEASWMDKTLITRLKFRYEANRGLQDEK